MIYECSDLLAMMAGLSKAINADLHITDLANENVI